ncbi:RnfABCDGE type electron transport complex subunit C [uncultured Dubosiella sp.]|uniref:RnfABCDGE type electron transport complex subunit C n=1 Tax=uncultured Dubosiella sp. TaxID=1937011 RepID=UPI00272F930C|nr:RnfABCDGE type electron transport complex subunit C [uncultured Dubosiella sp.]
MSLFLGKMCQHIPGHKAETEHEKVLEIMPAKEVYIPLVAGNNTDFEVLVHEGDQVFVGTKLAQTKSGFVVPIYSSVSGVFTGIAKRMHSSLRPQPHMVIQVDHKQTAIQAFAPIRYENASREELVEFTKNAGLVGLGGAGFPTYVKYLKPNGIDTVLINGVECEPYITADYKMMMDDPKHLVTGALIMKKMAEAQRVIICIKKTHPDLISVVKQAAENTGVEVREVPDVYPMGWERVLVREVLHKEYGNLPAEAGCIVNNAGTAIELARMMEHGEAIANKIVTVSGAGVKDPMNVSVPVGMPVKEIFEHTGFKLDSVRLIAGGPMMGKAIPNDMFVIDRAMNALTILDNPADNAIACLRCGSCSDHCPAGLQPVRIAMAMKEGNIEEMERRQAMRCIECGLCTYVCPSKIDVTENVRKAKRALALQKKK